MRSVLFALISLFILPFLPKAAPSQCIPWQDETVSVSNLRVSDTAHQVFAQALKALPSKQDALVEKKLDRALRLHPDYPAALTLRGILHFANLRLAQAEQDFQVALAIDPGYHGASIALAAIHNARREYSSAEKLAEGAVSRCPTFWWAYYELAESLIGERRYRDALAVLDRASIQATGRNPVLRIAKAYALDGLDQYSEAARELESYLRENRVDTDGLPKIREKLAQIKAQMAIASAETHERVSGNP